MSDPRPTAEPGRETDDGLGQVSDSTTRKGRLTVAGTAPVSHRLPIYPRGLGRWTPILFVHCGIEGNLVNRARFR